MSCLERYQDTKKLDFVILGPVKCGTCSLEQHYKNQNPNVGIFRAEIIWREDGLEQWEEILKAHPSARPIIITRDPADAIWSYYWYFKTRPIGMTLEKFLTIPIDNHQHGNLKNIVEGYDFAKWIKKWEPYNPIVVSLEELKQDPDFPLVNKTSNKPERKRKWWGWKNDEWPEITDEERKLIERLI